MFLESSAAPGPQQMLNNVEFQYYCHYSSIPGATAALSPQQGRGPSKRPGSALGASAAPPLEGARNSLVRVFGAEARAQLLRRGQPRRLQPLGLEAPPARIEEKWDLGPLGRKREAGASPTEASFPRAQHARPTPLLGRPDFRGLRGGSRGRWVLSRNPGRPGVPSPATGACGSCRKAGSLRWGPAAPQVELDRPSAEAGRGEAEGGDLGKLPGSWPGSDWGASEAPTSNTPPL